MGCIHYTVIANTVILETHFLTVKWLNLKIFWKIQKKAKATGKTSVNEARFAKSDIRLFHSG